jgi:hypothetical protein
MGWLRHLWCSLMWMVVCPALLVVVDGCMSWMADRRRELRWLRRTLPLRKRRPGLQHVLSKAFAAVLLKTYARFGSGVHVSTSAEVLVLVQTLFWFMYSEHSFGSVLIYSLIATDSDGLDCARLVWFCLLLIVSSSALPLLSRTCPFTAVPLSSLSIYLCRL